MPRSSAFAFSHDFRVATCTAMTVSVIPAASAAARTASRRSFGTLIK